MTLQIEGGDLNIFNRYLNVLGRFQRWTDLVFNRNRPRQDEGGLQQGKIQSQKGPKYNRFWAGR